MSDIKCSRCGGPTNSEFDMRLGMHGDMHTCIFFQRCQILAGEAREKMSQRYISSANDKINKLNEEIVTAKQLLQEMMHAGGIYPRGWYERAEEACC